MSAYHEAMTRPELIRHIEDLLEQLDSANQYLTALYKHKIALVKVVEAQSKKIAELEEQPKTSFRFTDERIDDKDKIIRKLEEKIAELEEQPLETITAARETIARQNAKLSALDEVIAMSNKEITELREAFEYIHGCVAEQMDNLDAYVDGRTGEIVWK